MDCSLLEKTNYTDISVGFVATDIIEYDIKSAGLSIIKQHKLLPDTEIDRLSQVPTKNARNVLIGKLRKEYQSLSQLEDLIMYYRLEFGHANNLDNADILSIKKDAIFIRERYCKYTKFGEVVFVPKNVYSSYININDIEIYNHRKKSDVKGIGINVEKHRDYMLKIIHDVSMWLEVYDKEHALDYVINIMDKYKHRFLDVNYYRTFNTESVYYLFYDNQMSYVDDISREMLPYCDISYNYDNVLVRLLNMVTT